MAQQEWKKWFTTSYLNPKHLPHLLECLEHTSPVSGLMFRKPKMDAPKIKSEDEPNVLVWETPFPVVWVFPNQSRTRGIRGLIAFFHGISSHNTKHVCFMQKLANLTQRIVVCPEYPGYQDNDFSPMVPLACLYLEETIRSIWRSLPCGERTWKPKTILFGHSLGAYFALQMASKMAFLEAVILLSPFCNLKDFVKSYVGAWTQIPLYFVRERMDNVAEAKKVHCPLYVWSAQLDTVSPTQMARQVFDACPSSTKEFFELPQTKHEVCINQNFELFRPKWEQWCGQQRNFNEVANKPNLAEAEAQAEVKAEVKAEAEKEAEAEAEAKAEKEEEEKTGEGEGAEAEANTSKYEKASEKRAKSELISAKKTSNEEAKTTETKIKTAPEKTETKIKTVLDLLYFDKRDIVYREGALQTTYKSLLEQSQSQQKEAVLLVTALCVCILIFVVILVVIIVVGMKRIESLKKNSLGLVTTHIQKEAPLSPPTK